MPSAPGSRVALTRKEMGILEVLLATADATRCRGAATAAAVTDEPSAATARDAPAAPTSAQLSHLWHNGPRRLAVAAGE